MAFKLNCQRDRVQLVGIFGSFSPLLDFIRVASSLCYFVSVYVLGSKVTKVAGMSLGYVFNLHSLRIAPNDCSKS